MTTDINFNNLLKLGVVSFTIQQRLAEYIKDENELCLLRCMGIVLKK